MSTYLDPETAEQPIVPGEHPDHAPQEDRPTSQPQLEQGKPGDNVLELVRRIRERAPSAISELLERRKDLIKAHNEALGEIEDALEMLGHRDAAENDPRVSVPSLPSPVPAEASPAAPVLRRRGRPPGIPNKPKTEASAPKKRGRPPKQKN